MHQDWRSLTFLHWRYPPEVVRPHLPDGLELDTYDGSAWVGLIPFLMDRVRAPAGPPAPWLSRFPETNVRTYVRGPDGQPAIWFFSLDAARLPVVLTARAGYGLPYMWAAMSVRRDGDTVAYRSRRHWPGPRGASCVARVAFGAPIADPGPLEVFLTARFHLYSTWAGRLVTAAAAHEPWPLRHGHVEELRQDLVPAAGLPAPDGAPLVHASDGVSVRIGAWRSVGRAHTGPPVGRH
jgi:uncharacterized protein YqjF (DUF2071 family)